MKSWNFDGASSRTLDSGEMSCLMTAEPSHDGDRTARARRKSARALLCPAGEAFLRAVGVLAFAMVAVVLPSPAAEAQTPTANSLPVLPDQIIVRRVAGNAPVGSDVGVPVSASDAEGDSLTYTLGGADAASFAIVAATGQLRTAAVLKPARGYHVLTVSVSDRKDADGSGPPTRGPVRFHPAADDGWRSVGDTITVIVEVIDDEAGVASSSGAAETSAAGAVQSAAVNSQPAFATYTAVRSVAENSAVGVDIGAPVAATDADSDSLTYTLDGTDAAKFAIVAATGQLRTAAVLNREAQSSYVVRVSVSDRKDADGDPDTGIDDTIWLTVEATNVDEAGVASITPSQPRVGQVLRARIDDPDLASVGASWTWHRSSDHSAWTPVGNTAYHYTPVAADVGKYLKAAGTYTEGGVEKTLEAVTTATVLAAEHVLELSVQSYVTGLEVPWDIAQALDGTMLITERGTVHGRPTAATLNVRRTDGTVAEVSADLSDPFTDLMGLVLDPEFAANRRFYTCHYHRGDDETAHLTQVTGWTIDAAYTTATRVDDPLVAVPIRTSWAMGCRLRFGPEGYLWISIGDYSGSAAQDLAGVDGKVLRVDAATGAGAPGNPFSAPNSPLIYSYGHRNPQGLALRPGTSQMWLVEHGPDWDDELNLMTGGGNYGWTGSGMTDRERFPGAVRAKWSSGQGTIANSGGIFLTGDWWGRWEGRLAVASLKDKSLRLFEFTPGGELVSEINVAALNDTYGRLRTPMIGSDDALYVTTSNYWATPGVDQILRVTPQVAPAFPSAVVTIWSAAEKADVSTVVARVAAEDRNHETLTYSLGGADAASFNLADTGLGELRVNEPFDYETRSSYSVTVTATDPGGRSDSVALTIEVEEDGEAGVTISRSALSVSEAGGTATYTVKLDAQPTGAVTVTPSTGNASVATPSGALTFSTGNFSTPQTVTVTGVDDLVDNPSDRTATISHAVTGGGYDDVAAASVTVTATDDDSAGVTVSETALAVAEAGGTATYTVKLDTMPTGDVTITPTSGDESVATASAALTFTTANYATPQTVTVTGVNDDLDNATDREATISHAVTGGGYDGVAVASVAVTATDDDNPGVTVSETTLTLVEADGTATYTVKLDAKPTGDVTVTPTSGDESVATASAALTFTTANYATPQTVTVTGVEDPDNATDRETTISHAVAGGGYDGVAVNSVAVVFAPAVSAPAAVEPVPHQRQIDWQEQEFIAFIHFGINTFNDVEWSDGTSPASGFNPTELDTDQWMRAYKAAGMRMVIITAKHHDGFTLWPSTTAPNYSVAAAPWKDGKGDLVADIAASARKYGLDFGIYVSGWDRYQEDVLGKTSDEYNDIFNTQLTEVLSNYGEVEEVWFDGATYSEYTMDWERFYTTIRTLQPNAAIAIAGPDVGHIGNEHGNGKDPMWSPTELTNENPRNQTAYRNFNPSSALVDSSFLGKSGTRTLYWRAEEVNVSIRTGWFWHADENNKLKSLMRLQEMYYGSVGGNSLFLLNVPPDTRGLVHENDVKRLKEFGDLIKATFATDYTDTATATASNVRGAGVVSTYAASNLIDDDKTTYWTTDDSITSPSFTVTFNAVKSVGLVELQEYIQLGQRVQTFKVEAMVGGSWTQVASGNTIGYKRILELANPVTTDKIRVTFTSSRDIPVIHSVGVYAQPVVAVSENTRPNNVAYLSHATQSSTHAPASLAVASNAVDGSTNGAHPNGSVSHTRGGAGSKPWWQTDLGASFDISEIKLWNRTDCCGSRLRDFHVFVSDSPFASDDPDVTSTATGVWHHRHTGTVGETAVISVPNVSGRYVRVQLRGNEPLSLAEVEVIGSAQNLVGSGTSTASGSLTGQGPAKAFDGSYATSWRAGSGTAWISYQFGSTGRPNVTGYAVTATATGLNSPTGWTFEGSNDGGTTWTSLDTQTGQTFIGGQRSTYSIESDQTFNIYRLSMTNSAGNAIDVAEIEFYAGPIPSLATNTPTATLSPLTLTVPEAGSAAYTVKLDAAPTVDVTVTPSSGDVSVATVSPANLTFTTDNYGTPQAVTVTGVNDDVDNATDRETTVTHAAAGGGYDGVALASVTVTVTDDDSAGVTVSGTALTVGEAGGRATYTVKLDTQPNGSVTVTPTSGNATVAIVSPGQLTFTTDNYATPQTVTVTGVDDAVDNASDRRATTVTHEAAGGGYDGVAVASVTVTATDDDSVGVTVSETTLRVAEAGGTVMYTIRLDTKPTGDVTITPTSGDESVATASGALTFTTASYATPQTVTVTGVDDDLDNATDRETTVSHAIAGGGYGGVAIASVAVTATDDDDPGIALSTLTLTVPEAGEATYTAKLDTKPTGDVLVAPFSADGGVATASPSFFAGTALTFTPSNWNTPQTVTVTGVDDAVVNTAARTTVIGHWAVGGGYGALGELPIDDVAVTLADDEEPPTVSMPTPSQAVDEGDAATVTLTLSAPLGAAVAVPLSYAHLTSEPDDIEALTEIVMPAGQTSEVRDIRTRQDDDGDNELFVVWIDEAKLPAYLHRGADHRVHVMIIDDDGAPDRVAEVRVVHNGTSLSASWDAPARATVYDVTYYNHRTGENARAAWDRAGTSLTITCDVRPEHLGEYCVDGDSAYTVGVRAGNAAGKSPWVDSARVEPPASATAWLLPSASDPSRRGVLRVSNRSGTAGEVSVTATDDAGRTYATLTLAVAAGATVEFDSRDLESGGAGLSGATGPGTGDWRLVIDGGALDIEALPYVRVAGGFAAPMDATAPRDASGALRVALFNPGGEQDARSLLRLVNPGSAEALASVSGVDDAGLSPGEPVLLTLPAGAACTVDATELETGTGLPCGPPQQGLGNGSGRWRLAVSSDAPLVAMNLLASPDGRLANLSRISAADADGVWHVPLFPSASSTSGRQGLVRVVSRAQRPGAVSILATDDGGAAYPPVTLRLPAGAAVDVDADDLELGSRQEGLSGSTGSGAGAWRLALSGDVDFAALAYARGTDGFLTPMRTAAPGAGGRLAYLAPDDGVLRLANAGTADALVTVAGTDDLGAPSASVVWVTVPAGTAVELPASALESGESTAIVSGALGDGAGAWRLSIGSDAATVSAMSLLPGPMGSLADLSGPTPATKTENTAR